MSYLRNLGIALSTSVLLLTGGHQPRPAYGSHAATRQRLVEGQINDSKFTLDLGSLACSGAPSDCSGGTLVARDPRGAEILVGLDCSGSYILTSTWKALRVKTIPLKPMFAMASNGGSRQLLVSEGPTWVQSGVWDSENSALLLTDSPARSVFYFSLGDGLVKQVIASDLNSGKKMRPFVIRPSGKGYVVHEADEGRLIWLDKDYNILKSFRIHDRVEPRSGIVRSLWAWAEVGDDIFVLSDIRRGKAEPYDWSTALLRINSQNPTDISVLLEESLESVSRQHARLGYPIMATAKGKAYILLSDGSPAIFEIGKQMKRLSAFPSDFTSFPKLDKDVPLEKFAEPFSRLETSQSVVALYGWRDSLYLLARRPDVGGVGTIWSVSKLDPDEDKIVHTSYLTTKRAHVVLVPGDKLWAIVEKERVEGVGKQRLSSITLVPSADLGASDSVVKVQKSSLRCSLHARKALSASR